MRNLVYEYIVQPTLSRASGVASGVASGAQRTTGSVLSTVGFETSGERVARAIREQEEARANEEWWMTYGVLYTVLALGGIYLVAKGPELYAQAKARGAFGGRGGRTRRY